MREVRWGTGSGMDGQGLFKQTGNRRGRTEKVPFEIQVLKVFQLLVTRRSRVRFRKLLSEGPSSEYFQFCRL